MFVFNRLVCDEMNRTISLTYSACHGLVPLVENDIRITSPGRDIIPDILTGRRWCADVSDSVPTANEFNDLRVYLVQLQSNGKVVTAMSL